MKIIKIANTDYCIKENTNTDTSRKIKLYKLFGFLDGVNSYYPNILINDEKELIDPYSEKVMSLNKTSFYEDEYYSINISNNNILNPVYFFIYNIDNYFHFIYDTIPYLYQYFELKKNQPNLKLLMNYSGEHKTDFYKFVIETLELLKITSDDIIIHDDKNYYHTIYVSSSLTFENNPNEKPCLQIFELYKKMI